MSLGEEGSVQRLRAESTRMSDINKVIEKLEAWREHDFHGDRQLSDEIIIADGWKVERDPTFQGGERWYYKIGGCETSASRDSRPHPIQDMNAALGLVPFRYQFALSFSIGDARGEYFASVWNDNLSAGETGSWAPRPTIAICLASMKALRIIRDAKG